MKNKSSVPSAPCPSAAWMPAPVGVKDNWSTDEDDAHCRPAPVSPSLPAVAAGHYVRLRQPHMDQSVAVVKSISQDGKGVRLESKLYGFNSWEVDNLERVCVEPFESHATLKADVERLTGALRDLLEMTEILKVGQNLDAVKAARLSLAEVGKQGS